MSVQAVELFAPSVRRGALRAGMRVEIVTVAWMAVEAVVAIGAGIVARSVLLTAFGLDSIIELVSGGVLLWRLALEVRGRAAHHVERAERQASWATAGLLVLLCVYIAAMAGLGLFTGTHPEGSLVGIALAIAAVIVMPLLARSKRRLAPKIDSSALRADAACSMTCAYMAGALLVGVAATTLAGWWWADYVGAIALLLWLVPETREACESAYAGRSSSEFCCRRGAATSATARPARERVRRLPRRRRT